MPPEIRPSTWRLVQSFPSPDGSRTLRERLPAELTDALQCGRRTNGVRQSYVWVDEATLVTETEVSCKRDNELWWISLDDFLHNSTGKPNGNHPSGAGNAGFGGGGGGGGYGYGYGNNNVERVNGSERGGGLESGFGAECGKKLERGKTVECGQRAECGGRVESVGRLESVRADCFEEEVRPFPRALIDHLKCGRLRSCHQHVQLDEHGRIEERVMVEVSATGEIIPSTTYLKSQNVFMEMCVPLSAEEAQAFFNKPTHLQGVRHTWLNGVHLVEVLSHDSWQALESTEVVIWNRKVTPHFRFIQNGAPPVISSNPWLDR